mmetsp:Transcript_36954/g.95426  ORF Transcript_36954/g.95426 Transcript_36954/m.95426 type:complete len:253 (+) Transcript_36954:2542-3300(+)
MSGTGCPCRHGQDAVCLVLVGHHPLPGSHLPASLHGDVDDAELPNGAYPHHEDVRHVLLASLHFPGQDHWLLLHERAAIRRCGLRRHRARPADRAPTLRGPTHAPARGRQERQQRATAADREGWRPLPGLRLAHVLRRDVAATLNADGARDGGGGPWCGAQPLFDVGVARDNNHLVAVRALRLQSLPIFLAVRGTGLPGLARIFPRRRWPALGRVVQQDAAASAPWLPTHGHRHQFLPGHVRAYGLVRCHER